MSGPPLGSSGHAVAACRARIDPYQPLFLVGVGHALAGTLLWPLAALHLIGYPGAVHRVLMIEGFEQSFIAGFLLTALGGLTHGGRSTTLEMALATFAQLGVGVAALAGRTTWAHGCFLGGMLVLLSAAATRSRRGRSHGRPPRELILIATALVLGLAGAIALLAGALPLGVRLVAQGEILTLVVGVGSLLVPTFLGHRSPGMVTTISNPGSRGQPAFFAAIAVVLAGACVLDASGFLRAAAAARAVGVSVVVLGVWGIHRGRTMTRLALALRVAGFAIMAGLWGAVLLPALPLLGEHVMFVAGYGLLTMGIATRVVVTHGGWPQQEEARLLHPMSWVALTFALAARVAAELVPAHATELWATSGALWSLAWLGWAARAVPRIVGRNRLQPV